MCISGNVTWIDSCGRVGAVREGCPLACLDGACVGCDAVGLTECSGVCTQLGTFDDCSACDDKCPFGATCESGNCACPDDEVDCSGTCTELGTEQDCSGCGDECPSGKYCVEGACVNEILIPAGSFWMGCNAAVDSECAYDEKPYHEVTLSGYYIDRTEVTLDAYNACIDAGYCTAIDDWHSGCNSDYYSGRGNHPINCVTWQQASAYCSWAGKRLPTEAEWEKAARGPDGRKFPWGNGAASCSYAVMYDESAGGSGCGLSSTMEVCSKSPAGDSPYHLCDMAGNVWEWVADWYAINYYANSPSVDPQGPDVSSGPPCYIDAANEPYKVLRGGAFDRYDYDWENGMMRTSLRSAGIEAGYTEDIIGFRCARDL